MSKVYYDKKYAVVATQLTKETVSECVEMLTADSSARITHSLNPLQLVWGSAIVKEGDYIILWDVNHSLSVMGQKEFNDRFGEV